MTGKKGHRGCAQNLPERSRSFDLLFLRSRRPRSRERERRSRERSPERSPERSRELCLKRVKDTINQQIHRNKSLTNTHTIITEIMSHTYSFRSRYTLQYLSALRAVGRWYKMSANRGMLLKRLISVKAGL